MLVFYQVMLKNLTKSKLPVQLGLQLFSKRVSSLS